MNRLTKKITALVSAVAVVAAIGTGAYLALTPQEARADGPNNNGPNGHWGIPAIHERGNAPPDISAEEAKGKEYNWHVGYWYSETHCPTIVGFQGTYHTIAEAEIRVDGPPGKRLLQVPIRIGNNQQCGQHTVYFSTIDNETKERAEHGKDYEPVTNGQVVYEDGETVGFAKVWIKGDKIIEDKESFDLVITGMTWDDTGYKDYKNEHGFTRTAEDAQKAARQGHQRTIRGVPAGQKSPHAELQVARINITSLHGSGEGWTEQGPKRPLPSLVKITSNQNVRIFEGTTAKFLVNAMLKRRSYGETCTEDVQVDWTTKETLGEASAYYKDYVADKGTLTLKATGQEGSSDYIRVKTLHDNVREDDEKVEVVLSNLRGGCNARFAWGPNGPTNAASIHIMDASSAEAPQQDLQDAAVHPYGAHTTDGTPLRFRVEISHQVDEAIVINYSTIEQRNNDRKWEAKKNQNYHHRAGKVRFPPRAETLYHVIEVPTAYRDISQPQLIQSIQLKITVQKGPAQASTQRVTGLIYDQHYDGEKSLAQAPQQYDPKPEPATPTPTTTPTPTPTPDQPDKPQPPPAGTKIGWAQREITVTEAETAGDGTVDVPFSIPEALVRDGYVEIGIANVEDGSIQTPLIRDLNLKWIGDNANRVVIHPYHNDNHARRLNVAHVKFRKGQDGNLRIQVWAPRDGKVEGDEVLWITALKVDHKADAQGGRVYWSGPKSVKVVIKDKDLVPGVVPRISIPPQPNVYLNSGDTIYQVIEGDDKWHMKGTITFDAPLPVPVKVHYTVLCKICASAVNSDGPGLSHLTRNWGPHSVVMPAGATQATVKWPMLGNTRVNHGWTAQDRTIYFGISRIEGDVFVMDHAKLSDDNGNIDYKLVPRRGTQPFKGNVPALVLELMHINEDDHEDALSLLQPEPQVEGKPLKFTVRRNGDTSQAVTVKYKTVAGTATSDVDYVESEGSTVIAAGESAAVIEVNTLRDLFVEGPESVGLEITSATATQKSTVLGTIIDLGNLAGAVQMSLGEPEPSSDGTVIFVPVCIDFDRIAQGKLQDMHFRWGVSDDKSVKNAQTAVAAPPRKTCLGYITLSSK